jgi:hypothetical protein
LTRLVQEEKYDTDKIRIPKYLEKDEYFLLIISQAKIEDDLSLYIAMTPAFKKHYEG